MANVTRLCGHCGEPGPLENRHCAHCGQRVVRQDDDQDARSGYLFEANNSYPIALRKAAWPILAGAAGLVLRAGWKLLQNKTARDVALNTAQNIIQTNLDKRSVADATGSSVKVQAQSPPTGRKRTIHIRSRWAVGDKDGILRQGQSEHTIEIDSE